MQRRSALPARPRVLFAVGSLFPVGGSESQVVEIMSHHLVTYFSESGETQLTTPNGEVLQVVVSAKLGKEVAE